MLIGLTGQIGAGKSTAAEILRSFGATIIDADRIGRKVVENQSVVLKRLVRVFGEDILTRSGKLRRKKLAELAFTSESARKKLNAIVHPPLLRELKAAARQALRKKKVVVIDAALLLEWKLDKSVDRTLVIHASRERRLRFLRTRGIGRADALAREKRQMSFAQYRERATDLIYNSGSEKELCEKLHRFWTTKVTI